jgi:hypothetical protein
MFVRIISQLGGKYFEKVVFIILLGVFPVDWWGISLEPKYVAINKTDVNLFVADSLYFPSFIANIFRCCGRETGAVWH